VRVAEERLGIKRPAGTAASDLTIKSDAQMSINNGVVIEADNESVGAAGQELVEYAADTAWVEYWDDEAKSYYYYNSITREASWEPPSSSESSLSGNGE